MKHIFNAKTAVLGSFSLVLMSALSGCQSAPEEKPAEQAEGQNKFLVVEQQPDGKYVVVEEMPTTGPSRAIIKETDENGTVTERVMTEAEMKTLAQQEYEKMQAGQSELNAEPQGEGMGLGGTILAAAAGALLGNVIGNALMNNSTFRKNQDASNRSAYHRSTGGAGSSATSGTQKKSYFGNDASKTTTASSSYGG